MALRLDFDTRGDRESQYINLAQLCISEMVLRGHSFAKDDFDIDPR